MRELVIEYTMEGRERGYNFTSSTQGFNDDTLKSVWRIAMPRGQGWGAAGYIGARSLKTFVLADGRIALSDVIVTDQRDESGRAGIRRAVVGVMPRGEYVEQLRARLATYALPIQAELNRKPGFGQRRRVPKITTDKRLILSYPYTSPENWQLVEALVLKAALERLESGWFGDGTVVPFTTLALAHRDESVVVVLPEEKARQITDAPVTSLRR